MIAQIIIFISTVDESMSCSLVLTLLMLQASDLQEMSLQTKGIYVNLRHSLGEIPIRGRQYIKGLCVMGKQLFASPNNSPQLCRAFWHLSTYSFNLCNFTVLFNLTVLIRLYYNSSRKKGCKKGSNKPIACYL